MSKVLSVNVGLPRECGWKNSIYGDLYAQGVDAVAFYTRKKVISEHWFGAEVPKDGWV